MRILELSAIIIPPRDVVRLPHGKEAAMELVILAMYIIFLTVLLLLRKK